MQVVVKLLKNINLTQVEILQMDGSSEFSHEQSGAGAGDEWELHCERIFPLI